MALDTKYRPLTYDDVLGQLSACQVLSQFVKEGKGFHQSYVFCGQHGSGKTTMGRILARALLCLDPQEGVACDKCESCRIFLEGGVHESFEELDAASKSKADDLDRIIQDIQYSTFSGNRRVYLFDESHQLSKKALDILLKPMEDNVEGTEDKQLVCIFCTTEPGKMRSTIFSRCAPAFVIRAVGAEAIAERLAYVCAQENITYDLDALVTIAEVTELHIRDALKTVEGVSMLGSVNRETVFQYLQLGANDLVLDVLDALGTALPVAMDLSTKLSQEVSPASSYERIAEACLYAYHAHLEVGKAPSQWASDRLQRLAERGPALLGIAARFSAPPHKPTRSTLIIDVASAHYALLGQAPPSRAANVVVEVSQAPQIETTAPEASAKGKVSAPTPVTSSPKAGSVPTNGTPAVNAGGVWEDPRAVGPGPAAVADEAPNTTRSNGLAPEVFRELVRHHLRSLNSGRYPRD